MEMQAPRNGRLIFREHHFPRTVEEREGRIVKFKSNRFNHSPSFTADEEIIRYQSPILLNEQIVFNGNAEQIFLLIMKRFRMQFSFYDFSAKLKYAIRQMEEHIAVKSAPIMIISLNKFRSGLVNRAVKRDILFPFRIGSF